MALPLDNTLREGQSGMLAFLETLATTLNGLAAAADGDVATWDAATSSLTPVTRAALATALGVQTAEELAASPEMIAAFADSPTFSAVDAGSTGGKTAWEAVTDEASPRLVAQLTTDDLPNGYTVLSLYPFTPTSRSKVSFWHKSPDDLAVGEDNLRPLSIEAHGSAEGGEHEVTFYSSNGDGSPTQNTSTKVFQWKWGPEWDGVIEFLSVIRGHAAFTPGDHNGAAGTFLGVHATDVGQPLIVLEHDSTDHRAQIDNRLGVLRLIPGSTGSILLKGATAHDTGVLDSNGAGIRSRGVITTTTGSNNGVWIGRNNGDVGQPVLCLSNGTPAQEAKIDNRSGTLRMLAGVGGTVRYMELTLAGNLGINNNSYGGGEQVISIRNASTIPSSNPANGGVLYVEAGALKWRGSAGTVTTLAPA